MSRKIILNLAISLDGCIADKSGGFSWISGHNDNSQNTEKQFDFPAFSKNCDTIVMGRKSYDDCGIENIENYEKKQFIVATSEKRVSIKNVEFVSGDIVQKISNLKDKEGEDIWLFGGAGLTDAFVQADIVDEYIIGIVPIILGKGRKLFDSEYPTINLKLVEATISDGISILRYIKRS